MLLPPPSPPSPTTNITIIIGAEAFLRHYHPATLLYRDSIITTPMFFTISYYYPNLLLVLAICRRRGHYPFCLPFRTDSNSPQCRYHLEVNRRAIRQADRIHRRRHHHHSLDVTVHYRRSRTGRCPLKTTGITAFIIYVPNTALRRTVLAHY